MAIALPNRIYVSGDFTAAVPCSLPAFSAPFEGVTINYLLMQDWMCDVNSYAAFNISTGNLPHPDFPDFFLVRESEKRDMGGGIVRWTRTYAKMPQSYSQPGAASYSFIAYVSSLGVFGRTAFTQSVTARIQYDYFKLDPVTGDVQDCNGSQKYAGVPGFLPSIYNVPAIKAQQYFDPSINAVKLNVVAVEISYGPDAATPQIAYPAPDGSENRPPYAAYPTREVYESWVDGANGILTGTTVKSYDPVTNVLTDTGLFEIVAIASQCSRWMGNIVERQTTYIKPQ